MEPLLIDVYGVIHSKILPFVFRSSLTAENYVYHPINAFHMLKRNAEWLSKLLPESSLYHQLFSNPNSTLQEATYGIVDIQEFYDLNIYDIINGTLQGDHFEIGHK